MRIGRLGSALLGLGVVVGVAASIGLLVGFEPSKLPPVLLDIAAYKLTFAAALGLMVVGAMVSRFSRQSAAREESARVAGEIRTGLLGEGPMQGTAPGEIREPERMGKRQDSE